MSTPIEPSPTSVSSLEPKPRGARPAPQTRLFYVAALLPPDAPDVTATGIEAGLMLQTHDAGGWRALAGEVDPEMFLGEDAEGRLQDPVWLAPRAIAHERALLSAHAACDLLPLPFGTVFRTLESLRDRCEAHAEAIVDFFVHCAGAAEWCVKVTADGARAIEHTVNQRLGAQIGGSDGGRGYLLAQARRREVEADVREELVMLADRQAEHLDVLARDSADRRAIAGEPGVEVLGHWAFLVDRASADSFESAACSIDDAAPDGVRFELSGPFPAYSFTPRLA